MIKRFYFNYKILILSILVFLIPVFNFINPINIPQLNNHDIKWAFNFNFLMITFITIKFIVFKLFTKPKNYKYFIIPYILYYISFYYLDIVNSFKYGRYFFFFINLLLIILFIFTKKNFFDYFYKFIFIFFFLNLGLCLINISTFFFQNNKEFHISKNENFKFDKKSNFNSNIYLLVLDSMIDVNNFEKMFNTEASSILIKKNNYKLINDITSPYNTTYAAMTSYFTANYFINENSNIDNYRNFFTENLENSENNALLKFLNKSKYQLIHFGNRFYQEEGSKYNWKNIAFADYKFLNNFFSESFFFFYEKSYLDGIYKKLLNKLNNRDKVIDNDDAIDKFIEFANKINFENSKKKFFLIHHLYPHHPWVHNDKCEKKKNVYENNYENSYKCTLKKINTFIKFIEQKDKNSNVFIVGNHGMYYHAGQPENLFLNSKKKFATKENLKLQFSTFGYFKVDKKYRKFLNKNLNNINISRLIISLINNGKPEFLPNKNYLLKYRGEKNFGEIKKIILQ